MADGITAGDKGGPPGSSLLARRAATLGQVPLEPAQVRAWRGPLSEARAGVRATGTASPASQHTSPVPSPPTFVGVARAPSRPGHRGLLSLPQTPGTERRPQFDTRVSAAASSHATSPLGGERRGHSDAGRAPAAETPVRWANETPFAARPADGRAAAAALLAPPASPAGPLEAGAFASASAHRRSSERSAATTVRSDRPSADLAFPPRRQSVMPQIEQAGRPLPWPGRAWGETVSRHAPLAWMLLNTVGSYLYVLGGVAVERGLYATQAVRPQPARSARAAAHGAPDFPPDPPDRPRPDLLGVLQAPAEALGLGAAGVGLGLAMALFAFQRYWADGVAGLRGSGAPAHARMRPYLFFALQAAATGVAIYFRSIYLEALRDHGQRHGIWGPVVAGSATSGVFSAIQAQAFSSSEVLRGPVFVRHRNTVARTARFAYGVGLRGLVYLVGQNPNAVPRQTLRIVSFTALSLGYAMPLTLVRQIASAGQAQQGAYALAGEVPPRSAWGLLPSSAVPPLLMAMYMVGQFLGGLFAIPVSQVAVSGELGGTMPASGGLFPPMGDHRPPQFYAAVVGVAVGFLLEVAAAGLLWRDARRHAQAVQAKADLLPDRPRVNAHRMANALFAGAALSSSCLVAMRLATETARPPLPAFLNFVTLSLGAVSLSLELLCMPELYALSQVVRGRRKFPLMQEALLAARFAGGMLADVWVVAANTPSFQPFGRDALLVGASFGTLIGVGVPTGVAYHEDARIFGANVDAYVFEQGLVELEEQPAAAS